MRNAVSVTALVVGACVVSACTGPRPVLVGNNETGAAAIATPSTYGMTTLTTGQQRACTEPRPNASLTSALVGELELTPAQAQTLVNAQASGGIAIGASTEFESVEFLSHGLFGICQLLAANVIDQFTALSLTQSLITEASKLETD